MEAKQDLYQLWLHYSSKNDEKSFRDFVSAFVSTWEDQLGLEWVHFPTVGEAKSDEGPHLSKLSEDLLPAIGKFLISPLHSSKKLITCSSILETEELIRCLIVLCRNFDNIPFIASCDFIGLLVGFAAAAIHQLSEGNIIEDQYPTVAPNFVVQLCHLLECLYDPYFTWRNFLSERPWPKEKLPFQPALLHVEVVPFLYDCFEVKIDQIAPHLCSELLHVLGAIASGAQHNGLRAICPATVNVVIDSIVKPGLRDETKFTAVNCFIAMVHTLLKSPPDQRQIEVGTMLVQYREAIRDVAELEWAVPKSDPSTPVQDFHPTASTPIILESPSSPDSSQSFDSQVFLPNPSEKSLVCGLVKSLRRIFAVDDDNTSASNAEVLMDVRIPDSLFDLLYRVEGRGDMEKQEVSMECVKMLSLILGSSKRCKEKMHADGGYRRLFSALHAQGRPSRGLLQALLAMSSAPTGDQLNDVEPILFLVHWLPDIARCDQFWLTVAVHHICTSTIQSKSLACEGKVLATLGNSVAQHAKLDQEAAFELIRILESLASVSISSVELKQFLMLLREDVEDKFPYHVQLLHAISSVARRDDPVECHAYFDIETDSDGIVVPPVKRWPGTGYGFSFHAWVQLINNEYEFQEGTRRQLFNVMTSSGNGLEMFFLPNGQLAIAILNKKEFLVATVPDHRIQDGFWHCVDICHMAARRPFGQNQLSVYIDGHQRLTAALKFPTTLDEFTSSFIGCPLKKSSKGTKEVPETKAGSAVLGAVGSFLPSIVTQVPNYFTLPLRSSSSSHPQDPNVKSYPVGMEDRIFGPAIPLGGHIALAALFHEALSYQQVRTLYEAGPTCRPLFCVEEGMEQADITSRLVLCYSASAFHQGRCLDLSPSGKYEARTNASLRKTESIKSAINGIGGTHVLLPILEMATASAGFESSSGHPGELAAPLMQRRPSTPAAARKAADSCNTPEELDDWEVLPSSSYSDWKLEQNPVSGFLSLLKNILTRSPSNQENFMKNNGIGIIGDMLTKVRPKLLDVNVLMAVQLMIEMARDTPNQQLLKALHHHILFNFNIWARSQFHIRIGHIQYICTVVKEDRRFYRRRYGVQFVLDTINQYHGSSMTNSSHENGPDMFMEGAPTPEDAKTLRGALLSLIKYYLLKDVNVKEVNAILGFLSTAKEETLVTEVLDMLISHLESATCKDQLLLLMYEPHAAETLYCLMLAKHFTHELKHKVLKLFYVLLRSERVYERHKMRLRLQDNSSTTLSHVGLYPGLLSSIDQSDYTMEFTVMLLDQILLTDTSSSYAGALALLYALSSAPIEIKLEAARKILTTTFMRPNAASQFAKQVGWQECISRLLVKKPIVGQPKQQDSIASIDLQDLPDLMSFDEENLELIAMERPSSPSSVSRISSTVSDAASAIESEIKEVADVVAGNIHYAADNISSVVTSAYSVFRQKTYEVQDRLEEFGGATRSRLLRGSLSSLDMDTPSPRTPASNLLSTTDLDSLSLSNKSISCSSSNEDLTSPRPDSVATDGISLDREDGVTPSPAQSEDQLLNQALEQWKALDAGKLGDREEELCYLVVNILFTVMWRGVEGASKEAWKERGQVLACINLLGLNNELYASHLELKRRLLEMALQASVSDLKDEGVAGPLASHAENGAQLLRWAYDLVVLDMHGDPSKKCSCKLLDGVLGLVDALLVFQDAPAEEWTEMAKLSFGILLSCAGFEDIELVAMATAKLHALIQTRHMSDPEEAAYLLCYLDTIVQNSLKGTQPEHYSFVLPVMKALLARISPTLALSSRLPTLPDTQAGPAFFERFQAYAQTPEWRALIDEKLKPLYRSYQSALLGEFSDAMNIFWAECYEGSKMALQKRARELADSRLRFQTLIASAFKSRQNEENARLASVQSQKRSELALVRKNWRQTKRFLNSTRGAWQTREQPNEHWKLSNQENVSRMRLKLTPNLAFDQHTEASNLRDNTGWMSRGTEDNDLAGLTSLSAALPQQVDEDSLPEEEWRRITAEAESDLTDNLGGKEKLLLSQECELVTLMSRVKGRLDVTNTHVSFNDLSPAKEDAERFDFKWALSKLREMHLRRYNLRRSALEFFLCDFTNYFINFTSKTRYKVYSQILRLRPPNLIHSNARSPAELLKVSSLTQRWVGWEISNFDYLMQLNTIAGRTYNDLSQYPVFPWIVADYTSPTLDLTDPNTFRNLSKPIGVVNPKNEAEVRTKFDNFEDPSGTIAKFHYGTHYSNSAGVLHYLVRVEPFTSLHIELQSGRFDVADRQFHSIPQTWKLLMDNPNDVKELTPEFFYFPEFLENQNKFDLGLLQGTKDRVTDVVLPAWAENAEDFIEKHRKALESEHVSAHIHEWIDLIFGWRQRGQPAVEALNVFYYCSYEGAVDLDAIADPFEREAVEGMINNFGQTPSQLMREPHPQRLSLSDALLRQIKGELRKPDLTAHLDKLRSCAVDVATDRDPIVFISSPRPPPRPAQRLFLPAGTPDCVVTVSKSGALGLHSWVPHDRHSSRGFSLDTDGSINNPKSRRKIPGPFHPSVQLSSQMFAVSHDARHLFSGGHWDNGIRVFSLTRGRTMAAAIHHSDIVTCVAIDRCGWYLMTGSRDTTCVIWDVSGLSGFSIIPTLAQVAPPATVSSSVPNSGTPPGGGSLLIQPVHTLYGHDLPITCVSIVTELDLAVSGSSDGSVNVYTVHEGHFLRTLQPINALDLEVTFLAISEQGHIAFSTNTKSESHAVHVYSINGKLLGSKPFPGRVTGLAIAGDMLLVSDDAGMLNLATLLKLRPTFDLPLHVPIQSVVVTQGNSHLLAPLRDGRLMVLGISGAVNT
ncbi:neurobeachin-like protein 1 isoform X2 [Neocloeon triangulifer]|uniref:neurobeachin-like protein 1 isoform X2 n=1 Tax=Neocloeon triangulifer TaxID=2078957 RepID=UPI00286F1E14|nr:neurobeachin-like protein 1 isoform X2 [Neocloeon triangulifer]